MTTRTEESSTIWVCVDCYETHHGVREDWREPPDREPLCLIDENVEVTAGMTLDEHEEDCPNRLAHERGDCGAENEECECEHVSFSWTSCDGCGSTLAGEREALTVWPSLRHAFILPEEG